MSDMRLIAVVLALSLPSAANALPDGVKLGMAAFELRLSNWNQPNPYTLRLYQPNSPLGTARAIAHPDVGVCYLEEATGLSVWTAWKRPRSSSGITERSSPN